MVNLQEDEEEKKSELPLGHDLTRSFNKLTIKNDKTKVVSLKEKRWKLISLLDFFKISLILIAWISLSIFISLPLLLVPDSLWVWLKSPYISMWMAIFAHSLIYKKLFSKNVGYKEFIGFKGIMVFIIIWVLDAASFSGLVYAHTESPISEGPQYFILIALSWIIVFALHFWLFFLLNRLILKIESKSSLKLKFMAMVGMQMLIGQLALALYFGLAFNKLTEINRYLAIIVWVCYPIGIGMVKMIEQKLISPFEVDEIYEFASLSLAAMPYRFIFLDVDNFVVAILIIIFKIAYKVTTNFIIFTPLFIKIKNKCLRKNLKIKDEQNEDTNIRSVRNIPKQLNLKAENTQSFPKANKVDIGISKLDKLWMKQSQKFFYQQFLDSWDILGALIIVLILRNFDDNAVSDLETKLYHLFIFEAVTELIWELFLTWVLPWIVMKFSILESFSPIKYSKASFKANVMYLTIISLLIFPMFIFVIFNVHP
jgi:predicted transport protein